MKFATPYDGKRKEHSTATALLDLDLDNKPNASKTEQCHKKECDINNVIKKYDKTGIITHVNEGLALYGDYTELNEYQDNLNMTIQAQASFDALPSAIRKKFENNPGTFFEFATNLDNMDEMVKLGLAILPTEDKPLDVNVVNPPEKETTKTE